MTALLRIAATTLATALFAAVAIVWMPEREPDALTVAARVVVEGTEVAGG